MRPMRPTIQSCTRAVLGLALSAALLAVVCVPARAGDDNDDVPFDTKILRSIMHGLGLKNGSEAAINYEERPPLVIPPDRTLPPPQRADAVVNNPAWPKDPDVARAKYEKHHQGGMSSDEVRAESMPLRPDQLTPNAGRVPRQQLHPGVTDASPGHNGEGLLSPSELGRDNTSLWDKMFHKDENQAAKFTGEPPRASLTEPPAGYQTPSPDQPYGNAKAGPPKPENNYENGVLQGTK